MVRSIFILFFLSRLLFLFGEEETGLRPYRLIHADSLEAVKINGAYVTELWGNVHFFYGDTEFYTDRADIFEEEKRVMMRGNVRVYDDTLSLQAKEVEYFRHQEKLDLKGGVFLKEVHQDSTWRTFEAKSVEYLREIRDLTARDQVKMYDSREEVHGSCGYLTYNGEEGFGYLKDKPELMLVQSDSILIKAEKIEYYDEYRKIVAIFEVETILTDYFLTSDFLIYFSETEKAVYRGEPQLFSEQFDAQANEVTIFFKENNIDHAALQDSCLVYYKTNEEGSKENWVSSDEMTFQFVDRIINECCAYFNIESNYIQQENRKIKQDYLENYAEGDRLIMHMNENGYIERINLNGNIEGRYRFKEK